jgi:hypothetical protein
MPTYTLENNGPTRDRHEQMPDGLTIGRLATLTGVSAKAIRYYGEIGLLPWPPRSENRYRRYGAADLTLRRGYRPASPRRRCPRH